MCTKAPVIPMLVKWIIVTSTSEVFISRTTCRVRRCPSYRCFAASPIIDTGNSGKALRLERQRVYSCWNINLGWWYGATDTVNASLECLVGVSVMEGVGWTGTLDEAKSIQKRLATNFPQIRQAHQRHPLGISVSQIRQQDIAHAESPASRPHISGSSHSCKAMHPIVTPVRTFGFSRCPRSQNPGQRGLEASHDDTLQLQTSSS